MSIKVAAPHLSGLETVIPTLMMVLVVQYGVMNGNTNTHDGTCG